MRILIVDDDIDSLENISQFLTELGHYVVECSDGLKALKLFATDIFDILFTDIKMPGISGIELVKNIRNLPGGKNIEIILFTGFGDTESAIEALRFGVYDYLLKPIKVEELVSITERVSEHRMLIKKNELLTKRGEVKIEKFAPKTTNDKNGEKLSLGTSAIGIFSSATRKILEYAKMLHEDRSIPVLIEGETGSGKEVVARLIHYGLNDEKRPFVDLNCACISPNLFESELFGYAAGAFTGGLNRGQLGKLDMADTGTIFLDEIADIPFDLQAKLLRVIQEKEFYRVGGLKKIKTDLRIICATNLNLEKCMLEGKFRQDLYYRLNVGRISLPPLRERSCEIIPLAQMFLEDISRKRGKNFNNISETACNMLLNYNWPGNIRELRNIIERAVFMNNGPDLMPEHINILKNINNSLKKSESAQNQSLKELLPIPDNNLLTLPANSFDLNKHIYSIIKQALQINGGNKTKTAAYLKITRRTLYSYLKHIVFE